MLFPQEGAACPQASGFTRALLRADGWHSLTMYNADGSHACERSNLLALKTSRDGGTGRRSGLKIRRPLRPWGFDPPSRHSSLNSFIINYLDETYSSSEGKKCTKFSIFLEGVYRIFPLLGASRSHAGACGSCFLEQSRLVADRFPTYPLSSALDQSNAIWRKNNGDVSFMIYGEVF